jgi:hypothetical protein
MIAIEQHRVGVLRSNPIAIAALFCTAMIGFITVPCFLLIGLSALLPLSSAGVGDAINALSWLVAAWGAGAVGWSVWQRTRAVARSSVRMEADGVHFRLADLLQGAETFIAWSDIQRVSRLPLKRSVAYAVTASGGRVVPVSSVSFLRPAAVAKQIAAAAGVTVT